MMIRFIAQMTLREAVGAWRHLALLGFTVAVGVAASVSVGSFTDSLQASVRRQARALVGADLYISRSTPFSPQVERLVDELARDGGLPGAVPGEDFARLTILQGMARVPGGAARLVQINALAGAYPFYGDQWTAPANAWRELAEDDTAIVEPSLLAMTGAVLGDELAIGDARFTIRATVHDLPGSISLLSSLGPRVYIPRHRLADTGLLAPTTRAQHRAFLRLPKAVDPAHLVQKYRPRLGPERVVLRTVAENEGRLNDQLTRLTHYLNLVGLLALLLGGIGVASAASVLVRRRMDTVAVLRCLGAERRTVLAVYLIEAAGLGLVGSLLGAALGSTLQLALPALLRDLLPIDVESAVSWSAMAGGVGLGVCVALLFSLPPLLAVRNVSPLRVLRSDLEPPPPAHALRIFLGLLAFAGVAAVAGLYLDSFGKGALFALGLGAALAALRLSAAGVSAAARRLLPARLPYVWRQGFQNLHRPRSQTVTVILALGFGAFLIQALLLVQHNLLRDLRGQSEASRPNLIFIDVQPHQREEIVELLAGEGAPPTALVPIVSMRIESIAGGPVRDILADTVPQPGDRHESRGRWAFRREYRSSYRDDLTDAETTVAGRWDPPVGEGPAPLSLEEGLARELGVHLGDEIVWNVQGRLVPSEVTHLRQVEWLRFEPNFFALFPEAVLVDAPQTFVAMTRADDAQHRGELQRLTADRFPNVTAFDITAVQQTLEKLIARVALALRFTAGFSLVAGVCVLAGAVAASRSERTREGALLKVLGATRGQILRVLVAEYLSLGLIATLVGSLLSIAGGWAVTRFVFDTRFVLPAGPLALLTITVAALSVGTGLAGSLGQLSQPPLALLRRE